MYFEELEKQYVEDAKMFREFVENRFSDLKDDRKFLNDVAENYNCRLDNTIDYLNKSKHYFRNEVLRQLRRDYNGIADKKRLVNSLYRRLKDGMMGIFLKTLSHRITLNYGCFKELNEVQHRAYKFTLAYAQDIVNWLGRNVCIDKYDLLVTKQAYKRVKKLVQLVEDKDALEPGLIIMPKQWNTDKRTEHK